MIVKPNQKKAWCKEYKNFLDLDFNGTVAKKYHDEKNHSYPIIEIKSLEKDETIKLNLALDESNLFKVVNLSDTLLKRKGENLVFRKKGGTIEELSKVDFGCNE
jgi:hypothetical protein